MAMQPEYACCASCTAQRWDALSQGGMPRQARNLRNSTVSSPMYDSLRDLTHTCHGLNPKTCH